MKETWREIRDYPNYLISNWGRVFSNRCGRILKPERDSGGYCRINLYKNKKPKHIRVHRLVLEAFIGACPKGMECNHKDGHKSGNRVTNLEWITHPQNIKHADESGLRNVRGEKHGNAKLTNKDILWIRELYTAGCRQENIASKFNIDQTNVSCIVNNKTWKHIVGVSHG